MALPRPTRTRRPREEWATKVTPPKRPRTDLVPYCRDEHWALRVGPGVLPELCERRGRTWRSLGALQMPPAGDALGYSVVLETHEGLRALARVNGDKYAYTGLRLCWRLPRHIPCTWLGNALLAVGLEDEEGDPPPQPETDRVALLLRWEAGTAADCVPAPAAAAPAAVPRPLGRVVHHRLRRAVSAVLCAEGLLLWRVHSVNAMPETCLLAWDGREWPLAEPVHFPTRWAVSPNGRTVVLAEFSRLLTGTERWVTLRVHARGCVVVRDVPRNDHYDRLRLSNAEGFMLSFDDNATVRLSRLPDPRIARTIPGTRAALAALGGWWGLGAAPPSPPPPRPHPPKPRGQALPLELRQHIGGFLLGSNTRSMPSDLHAAAHQLLWP